MSPASSTFLLCAIAVAAAAPCRADNSPPPRLQSEPRVHRTLTEDDNVRIEELKVRGLTRSIVVQPKKGPRKAYEVVPGSPARDPDNASTPRGAAGQRVWNVMSF